MVREVTGITRSDLDTQTRTLTLRASPRAVALASDLIEELERPSGELILEIEVLEVDRTYARNLGITPPQSAKAFTISTQQIQEAEASEQGLDRRDRAGPGNLDSQCDRIRRGRDDFFRHPSGHLGEFRADAFAGAPRPPNSSPRPGRPAGRLFRRRPHSRFADQRFLPAFVPGAISSTTGAINNPLVNYPVGNTPSFIATAALRGNGTFNDLIVANSADNTVSVLLGNGDGTFANQVAYPLAQDDR